MTDIGSEHNREARELFAPIAETYDRYATLLSFGQDPRWRAFLASRLDAGPTDTVLDVACGTAAVALELTRRTGCTVVGVDQSGSMLGEGRRRVAHAGLDDQITLQEARAEQLPFEDASFDGVTFTYLLRYVDDPIATLRELARVTRAGAPVASLEFAGPQHPLARGAWRVYTDIVLPLAGGLISRGWRDVGQFLGPSIRKFDRDWPLPRVTEAWHEAGFEHVHSRRLSLGGGVVTWGIRGQDAAI